MKTGIFEGRVGSLLVGRTVPKGPWLSLLILSLLTALVIERQLRISTFTAKYDSDISFDSSQIGEDIKCEHVVTGRPSTIIDCEGCTRIR